MRVIQRICSILLLLVTFGASALYAQTYDKLWKQVEQAQKKSLPQTVIKLADEIYRKGRQEQNAPQMLKAYICRETYQEGLTPDSLYSSLKYMESWAQSERNPVNKAILHSLLAYEYADLMRKNRRVLLSRTLLTVDEVPEDIREWSISQFVDKIDRCNRASLQDSIRLLNTSAEQYVPFVVLEDGSRFYGHDMYHLLVSRAVDAYRQLDGFSVDSLVQTRIERIYLDMMNAYRHRAGSEDAMLLCSLDYWNWKLTGGISQQPYPTFRMRQEKANREYLEVLNKLIKEYGSREVCAEVYIHKANHLRRLEPKRADEALKVCEEGLKRYPAYKRINELKNIREQILQPELILTMNESGYPGDSVNMRLHYRNVEGFTLNLYTTTLSEVPWMDHGINKDTYRKYARKFSSTHFGLSLIHIWVVLNIWEGVMSLKNVQNVPLFVLYTLLIWLCYFYHFYITFYCFQFTEHLSFLAGMVMFVGGTFAVIVPTPNGAGPWHFAVITMMMLYGVNATDAGIFALIVHGIQTLLVIVLGIYGSLHLVLANRTKK